LSFANPAARQQPCRGQAYSTEFPLIRQHRRDFDDIQGWQGVAVTGSAFPVSVPAPDFLEKSMRDVSEIER